MPKAADGLAVNAFATGLDHPRWLYVLPNGDVLVAETNTPKQEEAAVGGIKGMIMSWAAAARRRRRPEPEPHHPAAGRRRRRRGGDEVACSSKDLNSPFGMALIGDKLYVADTDALLRFDYIGGRDRDHRRRRPRSPICRQVPLNYHWTKSLVASPDGSRLYVGVGSNSNAGENGLDAEKDRARILEIDPATGEARAFATGLRNPVGLAFEPETGALWAVVNERDELGSDLVPDYLTSVKDGAFYGWPFSYWGQHVDERVKPQNPELGGEGDRARLFARQSCRRRSGLPSRKATCCRSNSAAAPLSASTARGTASRVQRLQGGVRAVRRRASRRGCRSMC